MQFRGLCVFLQTLKQSQIRDPLVRAQPLGDDLAQSRVAPCEPSSWSHTVGLVLELFWPEIVKVIEWRTSFSSFIMPPAEVRKTIDKKCNEIGYDRGVITSMSLSESKVVADFDCRGEDAT